MNDKTKKFLLYLFLFFIFLKLLSPGPGREGLFGGLTSITPVGILLVVLGGALLIISPFTAGLTAIPGIVALVGGLSVGWLGVTDLFGKTLSSPLAIGIFIFIGFMIIMKVFRR